MGVPWRASTFISTFASSLVVTRNNNTERRRAREDKINKTLRISRWRNRTSRVTCFQEDTRGSLRDSQEHTFASTWHDIIPREVKAGGEDDGAEHRQIYSMATHIHTRGRRRREQELFFTALPVLYLCIDSVILLRLMGRLILIPQSALRLFIIRTRDWNTTL